MTNSKFMKIAENKFMVELKKLGFSYNKKEKYFFSFYKDIVFRIQLIKNKYIVFCFEHNINCIKKDYELFPKYFLNETPEYIESTNWDYSDVHEDNKKINLIINEMLFILRYYIHNIASSIANSYNIDIYIQQEYDKEYRTLFEEQRAFSNSELFEMNYRLNSEEQYKYSHKYFEDFYIFDNEKKEQEFPFTIFKNQMLKRIKKNSIIYNSDVSKLKKKYANCLLKKNSNVYQIKVRKFLFETLEGNSLVSALERNGYVFYNDNGCYENINQAHFDNTKNGFDVTVCIRDYIFLEFEINNKKDYYTEYLSQYDFSSFDIGWLIGDKIKVKQNVKEALVALNKKLENIEL